MLGKEEKLADTDSVILNGLQMYLQITKSSKYEAKKATNVTSTHQANVQMEIVYILLWEKLQIHRSVKFTHFLMGRLVKVLALKISCQALQIDLVYASIV